jgi:hypothetical protein
MQIIMRPISTTVLLLLLSLLCTSCNSEARDKLKIAASLVDTPIAVRKIYLKDLRRMYKELQGQSIETEGIVWFEFENVSICPDREALLDEERNCFWLGFHPDMELNDSLMQLASGSRFIIKGTIDTAETGHFGTYLGAITNIYFMQQK